MTTNDVKAVRLEIKELQDKCDSIYKAFVSRHKIDCLQEEFLFDHVFNGYLTEEEVLLKLNEKG